MVKELVNGARVLASTQIKVRLCRISCVWLMLNELDIMHQRTYVVVFL